MAFYCSDCVTWVNSQDANRYGEKWCDYDRKYRKPDQPIYGCKGFVWARRSIITKVCEILGVDGANLFEAFDEVKEEYLVPDAIDKLIDYNTVGPVIAERLETDPCKEQVAKNLLDNFMVPAAAYSKMGNYEEATNIYARMVNLLAHIYQATKDNIEKEQRFNQLIKLHI